MRSAGQQAGRGENRAVPFRRTGDEAAAVAIDAVARGEDLEECDPFEQLAEAADPAPQFRGADVMQRVAADDEVETAVEAQFAKLADLIGKPEWHDDPRFVDRYGWEAHLESEIRPAIEAWSSHQTRAEVAAALNAAGIASGPSLTAPEVIADPHVAQHHMLVEMERPDGVADPVLVPGNPVKLSNVAEGPETRVPWLGEHTDEVLSEELGLGEARRAELRAEGVIA